ncbi:hypothetical protein PENSPDRAFT_736487 [Peniophora sp. CONT]|nr:hypothetical protein PENSPDRAFT_736487 [Peniophora sp. CONT]
MAASNATAERLTGIAGDVKAIADYHVFPLLLESVLYALFTVLVVYYCVQYWQDTRRVRGIFVVSMCLYAACSLAWALDVCLLWLELYHFVPGRLSLVDPDGAVDQTLAGFDTKSVAANVLLVHGICESVINPPAFAIRFNASLNGKASIILITIALSSTTIAQIFATGLMARKAWEHRRAIRQLPQMRTSPKQIGLVTVLYIVIETGIIYTILWIVCLLLHDRILGERGYQWSTYWMCQIAGIYPTLIVVIVSLRTSMLERSNTDSVCLDDGPLCFATTANDSDVLHVTVKQELSIGTVEHTYPCD